MQVIYGVDNNFFGREISNWLRVQKIIAYLLLSNIYKLKTVNQVLSFSYPNGLNEVDSNLQLTSSFSSWSSKVKRK